jgi:linearmycin/streptolysin S transport system ATP-binding protein
MPADDPSRFDDASAAVISATMYGCEIVCPAAMGSGWSSYANSASSGGRNASRGTVRIGLVGPNGAGKTTLLKMLSTRIRPTGGEAWVHGKHVVRDMSAVRRLVNVAPQEEAVYPDLTGAENLAFFAELYGVPRVERTRRVAEALEIVELQSRRDDRVATYSGGMRRRLNLGCALVTAPRVILLDEPTVGVDPQSRVHIFDAVRRLCVNGTTILYITHYLEEAETLCDRIAIMDEGRIIAMGTLAELLALSKVTEVIELRLVRPLVSVAPSKRWQASRKSRRCRTRCASSRAVPRRCYRASTALGGASAARSCRPESRRPRSPTSFSS